MKSQQPATATTPPPPPPSRDFLLHLEAYLAKRDGVDKLLKICRYASKLILSSTLLPSAHPLNQRFRSFESSVGLSRKAFRLGKFIQDVNALRSSSSSSSSSTSIVMLLLSFLSYGGEGVYYFLEQIVWLSKSGLILIDARHSRNLQKVSAFAELVGYIGSISLKLLDLRVLNHNIACLTSTLEICIARARGDDHPSTTTTTTTTTTDHSLKLQSLKDKCLLKKLSVLQDLADSFMALADLRDTKPLPFSSPFFLSSAGLLSALISTHKNWLSS